MFPRRRPCPSFPERTRMRRQGGHTAQAYRLCHLLNKYRYAPISIVVEEGTVRASFDNGDHQIVTVEITAGATDTDACLVTELIIRATRAGIGPLSV